MASCRPYGDGSKYGDGELYCSGISAKARSGVFYEVVAHTLSVQVAHEGFFLLDTIKALVQDAKYADAGYGVFPDLEDVTYMSVRISTSGAFRLDTIRPSVRVMTRQP